MQLEEGGRGVANAHLAPCEAHAAEVVGEHEGVVVAQVLDDLCGGKKRGRGQTPGGDMKQGWGWEAGLGQEEGW